MKEIRWHGRGGNGAFTAARLLGLAASIYGGYYAQAFPSFGPERRGAPVLGFTRIDDMPIKDHSHVYSCDCVVVLDETLFESVDVLQGIKQNGILIVNTTKKRTDYNIRSDIQFFSIDATKIALDILGIPLVNTVLLGVLAKAAGYVTLKMLDQAIDSSMPKELCEKNKRAIHDAYNLAKKD